MTSLARATLARLDWSTPLPALGLAAGLGLMIGVAAAIGSPTTTLAALVGCGLVLAILRQPAVGLYGLVGLAYLLPFANIPARVGFQLTALEAILGLTLGVVVLRSLAKRQALALPRQLWPFALVLGLAGLSFLLSLPHTGGTDLYRRVAKLFLAMAVLPLALALTSGGRHLRPLAIAIILAGGLEAALAVGLHRLPPETMVRLLSSLGPLGYPVGADVLRYLPGENDTYTDVLRATGTSIDPNVLGGALMLAACLQLTQLFGTRPLLPRWLLLPLAGLTVCAMLLSHSRASWLGLAAAALALASLQNRRLWLGILPAALAVALLPAGRAIYGRVLSGFAGQDKAASMRLDEYRNALEIVAAHPGLGIGFGAPPTIDLAAGVSSLYLTVAETMGLPALALYLGLLGWLLWRSGRQLLRPLEPVRQGLLAGLLATVLAALAAGLFDHYFASTAFPHTVALFWLCCALLWRASDPQPAPNEAGALLSSARE